MNRRTYIASAGSAVIGASALLGSTAASAIGATRDLDIRTATDENAYAGLQKIPGSRNSNQLVNRGDGRLTVDIGGRGGQGVNSDSLTLFDDLFRIRNQGTTSVRAGVFLTGRHTDRVGLLKNNELETVWNTAIQPGRAIDVGLYAFTDGIPGGTQLINGIFVVFIDESQLDNFRNQASSLVPNSAQPDDEISQEEWSAIWDDVDWTAFERSWRSMLAGSLR